MGRIKAVSAKKKKKNRPVTRIGAKQYKKKRFAAQRKTEVAGHDNELTQAVMKEPGDNARATALQHYTRVGTTVDPNATLSEKQIRRASLKSIKRSKLPDPEPELKPLGRPVSELEGTVLCNLLLKYGTNFKRMSLDYKLNPFQLTPAQIQKKMANYLKFERAAFPTEYEEMEAQGLIVDGPELTDPRRRKRPEVVDFEEDA